MNYLSASPVLQKVLFSKLVVMRLVLKIRTIVASFIINKHLILVALHQAKPSIYLIPI